MRKFILVLALIFMVASVSCTKTPEQKACTLDAKVCPDGSAVGRAGPNCEFAPCPVSSELPTQEKLAAVECTDEQREVTGCTREYMPVCGWFEDYIKCIKYPCAATYSNSCSACQNPNVAYYTGGECPKEGDLKQV